jgi:hypothetical protein
MTYTFIARTCSDLPVSVCCRVMEVSTSGCYAWPANPVSDKDLDDAFLTNIIVDIHRMSRHSYGSPRVQAELRLGEGIWCSKKTSGAPDAPGRGERDLSASAPGLHPSGWLRPTLRRPRAPTVRSGRTRSAVGHRRRAPRGALEPRGGARPSPLGRRSDRVKLGAVQSGRRR